MNETRGQQSGSLLRAGRVLAGALLTPSGASWARRRSRAGRFALIGILAVGGAAAAYAATQPSSLPAGDKAAIEAVVRDYILEHPEIVREAMVKLETQRVAGLVDANRTMLETPYAGAWEGAAKPEVTLVAFMDYACGYCRATVPTIARLLREDPGLRVVYRELPIISEASVPAARVSLYAAESGRFSAFHAAMYAEEGVDNATILDAAKKAGLDMDKVKAELANQARNPNFSQNIKLAQSLEAEGTPLLVVGDQVFYGAVSYETLRDAIAKARKAG
jgi:protein-disulfide isomerase